MFGRPYEPGKHCLAYCGDDVCNCDAGPMGRPPLDAPPVDPETQAHLDRLKVENGVTTNRGVLREALRRARAPSRSASGEGK